jgi:mono/diheme cytochrome c family protein
VREAVTLNIKFNTNGRRAPALAVLLLAACQPAPPPFTEAQVLGGVSVPAVTLNEGQKLFNRYCASCHGYDGGGQGPAARNLDARDFRTGRFLYKSTPGDELPTDLDLAVTIKKGRVDKGMPAWGGLRDDDVLALVSYIKTFSPRWREATNAAGEGSPATR